MKNCNSGNRIKKYILLVFIGITFLSSYTNPCFSQSNAIGDRNKATILQADQALAIKDYAGALFLYNKASLANPDDNYIAGKINEINKILDATPDSKAQLFEDIILKAESLFNRKDYPNSKSEFLKAILIDPSAQFPKDRLAQISAVYSDPDDLIIFNNAIATGDKALAGRDFDKAILSYEKALGVKPNTNSVKEKINAAKKQQADYKSRTEQAAKHITSADGLLKTEKYAEARAEYQKSLELTPENQYAKLKIQEIDNYEVNKKALQDSYDKSIEQADQFYINRDFANARLKYKEALKVKPQARYPKDMLEKTTTGESQLQSDQQKYDAILASAGKFYTSADYEAALLGYKSALAIKPSENFPQSRITEIEKLLAEKTSRKEAFDIAIKKGDQSLEEKKYDVALSHYSDAQSLFPGEKYPSQKIEEIKAITGKQKESDENYRKAITEADKLFIQDKFADAISTYTKALGFKPGEAYPQQKITEAQASLANLKSREENYATAIANGDRFLSESKYNDAMDSYNKALSIKPNEAYPLGKTSEINKIIAKQRADSDLKALQESYDKEIADGDKFLTDKDYLNSMASYKNAKNIKPGEAYPTQKIIEIQSILDKDKAEGQRYKEAIAEADKLFADKKYTEALVPYQLASKIKPGEKYPQDQVAGINQALAEQKKLDEDYQKLIVEGATQLNAGKYNEARHFYADAGILKPSENLPKDKIAEIDGIFADLKNKDQSFTKHISDGDAFFKDKKFVEALTEYKSASAVKPAETYPKTQVEKINILMAEQQKLDNDFLAFVTTADQLFDSKKYEEAISDYRKALALKTSEKYPADQITAAEKLIADLKALQETYNNAIADGDKKLSAGDYENAFIAFTKANSAKPAEAYPQQKITEIQAVLDKQKAENSRYQEAVALADKFFASRKYIDALEPYQRASTIKPSEKYPQEQIIRINNLIAEQKKLDEGYQKLITDADIQFKAAKFDEAISLFTKAGTLKPAEKLPLDKIAEINGILAVLKLKDENYLKALNTAAELYGAKNLPASIKSYEEALAIKPDEKYPRERITAITAEAKAIDENYSGAIALGDSKLASQSLMEALNAFQNALEIKPTEAYPKTKISEINSTLLARKEESEKMYASFIADGDRFFGTKDYRGAVSAFTKASGIKPDETYPKQRITEINKIVEEIELARRAEYNKALGEADKLYNTKVFDLAIDAYETAAKINPDDSYPALQISKIRKYMSDHAIQDLFSQALVINEGSEKKLTFSAIEPLLRKNNYILLKARSTGKTAPKVYLNYGKDNTKNGGIVLRSIDSSTISDYLIRISIQDKWYREDNNWISLSVETGDIEITKVQIAAGDD